MKAYEGLTRTGQIRRLAVAVRDALAAWGLESAPLRVVHHFHNTTFKVGHDYALRIARPHYQTDNALRSEVIFLEHLAASDVGAPVPVRTTTGEPLAVGDEGRGCLLFVVGGRLPRYLWPVAYRKIDRSVSHSTGARSSV